MMLSQTLSSDDLPLKERLWTGSALIGSWINTVSPVVAELMAAAGFDFLTVDAEHSAVDLVQAQTLLQAVRSGDAGCRGFVRVPGADYDLIKRYMDAGADGIICPLVNTAAAARDVVDAVKYPPMGRRGVGFCRDNLYGIQLEETLERSNAETVVCVQIEHVEAVENIDAILSVDGVDAAFIGPYDLTASLGITAQFNHADYLAAKQTILDACKRHHVTAGIHVVEPDVDQVVEAYEAGYRLIAFSLDITILSTVCRNAVKTLKQLTM